MPKLLLSFFILGLSFGFGPCLASCGPLLVSYVAGTHKNVYQAVSAYLLFSSSRILAYILLGLALFVAGQFTVNYILGDSARYFYLAAGIFIITIGTLVTFGKKANNKICRRLNQVLLKRDSKSVLLLGLFIGILPCAPLFSAFASMALIAKSWWDALLCSLFFGLGTVFSPLLLFVIFAGLIPSFMRNLNPILYRVFNMICGLIIIFLGAGLVIKFF